MGKARSVKQEFGGGVETLHYVFLLLAHRYTFLSWKTASSFNDSMNGWNDR